MSFTLAIVGRPNVGKSTLFNRLVGKRLALVDDRPGVTRDWRAADARLGVLRFTALDTAGFDEGDEDPLSPRLREVTLAAVDQADACLFIYDARAGLTPFDEALAELLRRTGKPVIVAPNKTEGGAGQPGVDEGWSLGFGEPVPLSAAHGEGMSDLAIALTDLVETKALRAAPDEAAEEEEAFDPDAPWTPDPTKPLRLAVAGRPNVGKSTLANALLGLDRFLTGPESGLTRDSIGVEWDWSGPDGPRRVKLFDTAGLRRRARVVDRVEKLSTSDTVRAVRFAEVVVLVMDSTQAFDRQDLQIADLILREGRGLVLALNKWDLMENPQGALKEFRIEAERLLPQARGAPVVALSGLTGEGLQRLMPAVVRMHRDWNARVKTSDLNRWLAAMLERHPPPAPGGRRLKIRYMAQVKARPPTFTAFANRPDAFPESYVRFLVNGLRDAFDIQGAPIRLRLKGGRNPYASSSS